MKGLETDRFTNPYTLRDTGQGLQRVQAAPRVHFALRSIVPRTQQSLGAWVGSSVIHLGDTNVPNALMFIDKYTQVGYILRPIVKTIDSLEQLVAAHPETQQYVTRAFGGVAAAHGRNLRPAEFLRREEVNPPHEPYPD